MWYVFLLSPCVLQVLPISSLIRRTCRFLNSLWSLSFTPVTFLLSPCVLQVLPISSLIRRICRFSNNLWPLGTTSVTLVSATGRSRLKDRPALLQCVNKHLAVISLLLTVLGAFRHRRYTRNGTEKLWVQWKWCSGTLLYFGPFVKFCPVFYILRPIWMISLTNGWVNMSSVELGVVQAALYFRAKRISIRALHMSDLGVILHSVHPRLQLGARWPTKWYRYWSGDG
jgi:hypothetical protein